MLPSSHWAVQVPSRLSSTGQESTALIISVPKLEKPVQGSAPWPFLKTLPLACQTATHVSVWQRGWSVYGQSGSIVAGPTAQVLPQVSLLNLMHGWCHTAVFLFILGLKAHRPILTAATSQTVPRYCRCSKAARSTANQLCEVAVQASVYAMCWPSPGFYLCCMLFPPFLCLCNVLL